jgi:hypothetical protein
VNQWPGRCGYGPRQPFVVISWSANRNFVDHAVAGPTSVLRFIEDNWLAGRRHGLTGQTVVLPEDDLAAHQKHCAQFHAELKPKGLLETEAVQTIADTYWRLDRIRPMENNLFSLGFREQPEELATDPAIHFALAQAKALDGRGDLLVRLSLYEQRLNRTLVLAKAELKQLQQERVEAEKEALRAAAGIRNLKQTLNRPWQPEQDDFEFSNAERTPWMRRRRLTRQAQDLKYHDRLADPEEQIDGKVAVLEPARQVGRPILAAASFPAGSVGLGLVPDRR